MGYTLHCPKCKLTWSWCRTFHSRSPSICPGLLLHNAKMGTYGTYFRQIFAPVTVIQIFRSLRISVTTADFSYADSLVFTHDAAHCALDALCAGATVLTDTNMALAGISKPALAKLGCKAVCYMADPDVAAAARAAGTTRAVASMDKACGIEGPLIVAVGNAPTALLRLAELMDAGKIAPALVVGVPVGFVNVVEAKEELLARRVPAVVARGRKGGSTVAAAIMNALLYQITRPGGPK